SMARARTMSTARRSRSLHSRLELLNCSIPSVLWRRRVHVPAHKDPNGSIALPVSKPGFRSRTAGARYGSAPVQGPAFPAARVVPQSKASTLEAALPGDPLQVRGYALTPRTMEAP